MEARGLRSGERALRSEGRRRRPQVLWSGRKPRGGPPGSGRGVETPQGIDTPRVDALPRRDKTPRVATKGNRVTGGGGQGRGGGGNPTTNRASADSGADGGNDGMARGPRTALPPRPRYTAADNDSAGPLPQKSDGADGARTENGMHLRREYGLLALEDPEGGRSKAGPWVRRDVHGATRGTSENGADRDNNRGQDRAARAPSAWHAGGQRRGADPPQPVTCA